MTKPEISELIEIFDDRLDKRLVSHLTGLEARLEQSLATKLEEHLAKRLEDRLATRLEERLAAGLDERLAVRLATRLTASLGAKLEDSITKKLMRYIDAVAERFVACEQRLIEAFDGKLEMRLKPIEEKLEYLTGEVSAIRHAMRDYSLVQQNHGNRIARLENKVA